MGGGLMNLVSEGQQSVILNGNPSKTFYKAVYQKYTNFGLQKFRVDFEGAKTMQLNEESTFTFKIPRYADLLMDCYLSVDLPNIWSGIAPPRAVINADGSTTYTPWAPYEFKWIDNIGAQMISEIVITCGNQTLQQYSGQYILSSVNRDFSGEKKALFDKMSGNVPELNDPGNAGTRVNAYPNAYYTDNPAGAEPSIRGRTIYVPLNSWFGLKTQQAFPLISLQYNELQITVTLRPINELFRIRDVFDHVNNFPYIAPNFNQFYQQMYRFLHPPPDVAIGASSYLDTRSIWNSNIHLNSTYAFLSNDENQLFAKNEQKYLFKQVHENIFYNVTGANKIQLESIGLVSSWMWYLQRSDANLRNEWSNYTNWPYNYIPNDLIWAPAEGNYPNPEPVTDVSNNIIPTTLGPGVNPTGFLSGLMITGDYSMQNEKNILLGLGILLDGQYRENIQPYGVYNFIEKYTRTPGNATDGLFCYNFCLDTSPTNLQPSGAINMNRFNQIEFEFTTVIPQLDPLAQVLTICDPETRTIIGINKPTWRIFDYNFNLYLMEERINVITFVGGNAALMYAT
jgi:hypothetical protein